MVEVSGITAFEGKNCKQVIHKVCQLVKTNTKVGNIGIVPRIRNGSIIMKFSDMPSRDEIFTKKNNLEGITTADLELGGDENSIFINVSLALETK